MGRNSTMPSSTALGQNPLYCSAKPSCSVGNQERFEFTTGSLCILLLNRLPQTIQRLAHSHQGIPIPRGAVVFVCVDEIVQPANRLLIRRCWLKAKTGQ